MYCAANYNFVEHIITQKASTGTYEHFIKPLWLKNRIQSHANSEAPDEKCKFLYSLTESDLKLIGNNHLELVLFRLVAGKICARKIKGDLPLQSYLLITNRIYILYSPQNSIHSWIPIQVNDINESILEYNKDPKTPTDPVNSRSEFIYEAQKLNRRNSWQCVKKKREDQHVDCDCLLNIQ
jgi:hypothetical protein